MNSEYKITLFRALANAELTFRKARAQLYSYPIPDPVVAYPSLDYIRGQISAYKDIIFLCELEDEHLDWEMQQCK